MTSIHSVTSAAFNTTMPLTAINTLQGESIFSSGIDALTSLLNSVAASGMVQFEQIQQRANVARDTQEQANAVDAVLAHMIKDDAREAVPNKVIEYMRQNGILVQGKTIDEFMDAGKDPQTAAMTLDKGNMAAVKAALDNFSGRSSDFVSQAQLQIQKSLQTYNVGVTMISSLQTTLMELNKSIAARLGGQ